MRAIKECRACGASLTTFLDLGKQYLADFREDDLRPKSYPLTVAVCDTCRLVQLRHSVPQGEMYHERYGFKSGISGTIKADLDDAVLHAFQYISDPKSWLDIASNDGTLLSFVPTDVYRVGVDPVGFLCKEAAQYADLIINEYFNEDIGGEYDVVTSISCFYDMPDPAKFVRDVKSVLAPHGVWLIQQNYLLTTMQLGAVDNFCHEHLEYYSLMALENLLERFGLEVNEVSLSTVNGGSIRTIVSHKGTFPIDSSVMIQRDRESDYGLDKLMSYVEFAGEVGTKLNELYQLVNHLKSEGKTISILAASTRGATIWQSANIGEDLIDYAVERNPAKVGKMFSALNIPIISETRFMESPTDYAIIGPWFFAEEIINRSVDYLEGGGSLIIPLPEVKVITIEETSNISTNL